MLKAHDQDFKTTPELFLEYDFWKWNAQTMLCLTLFFPMFFFHPPPSPRKGFLMSLGGSKENTGKKGLNWGHYILILNVLKVNNKDTRRTSVTSSSYFYRIIYCFKKSSFYWVLPHQSSSFTNYSEFCFVFPHCKLPVLRSRKWLQIYWWHNNIIMNFVWLKVACFTVNPNFNLKIFVLLMIIHLVFNRVLWNHTNFLKKVINFILLKEQPCGCCTKGLICGFYQRNIQ